MTNKPFGILYVGVTANRAERVLAHREGRGSSFCRRYNCSQLVLVERHDAIEAAIAREKALKNWSRVWKHRLISDANPGWADLYASING